jgi:dipeptidyl aminopeptidase/acylaminoacyl peptidase
VTAPDPFLPEEFVRLPRVGGLALSKDGRRLVTGAQRLSADGKRFVSALHELDLPGSGPPRRITRSSAGESASTFLSTGDLLFTSSRRDPDAEPPPEGDSAAKDERHGLWLLPAAGGEAAPLALPAGGVEVVTAALRAPVVAVAVAVFPGDEAGTADEEHEKRRRDAGVAALIFDDLPIRYWDHPLGPRTRRLLSARVDPTGAPLELHDLTPDARGELLETGFALSPDGTTVVAGWRTSTLARRADLIAIDVASGERRVISTVDGEHTAPAVSPDGSRVVCVRDLHADPEHPGRTHLWIVDLMTGSGHDPLPGFHLAPLAPLWAADSAAILFTCDEHGQRPVFRLDLGESPDAGRLVRLSAEGAFDSVQAAPDGERVFAVRSTQWSPPEVVALDAHAPDQSPRAIPSPSIAPAIPGPTERVCIRTGRGHDVEGWLTLPEAPATDADPVPLLLCIHGGPVASFCEWSWRWNPHVFARHGYAVLALDPCLSTGYGWEHIDRGWSHWGPETTADLLEGLEGVLAMHPQLDAARVAAIGASFGGYMTNWLAGHSDRFRALVTHAGVYALDQLHGTSDVATWFDEFYGDPFTERGRELLRENSPHHSADRFSAPVLVIHGDLDYRVPVGEALRLWTDLRRRRVPARFLYFPDENHWILRPPNVRVWYDCVLAFLDEHLRGAPWTPSALL